MCDGSGGGGDGVVILIGWCGGGVVVMAVQFGRVGNDVVCMFYRSVRARIL